MIAAIPSAVLIGVDGQPVSVEVHVSNGIPGFTVVGLPDAAVSASRVTGYGLPYCPADCHGHCAGSPSISLHPGLDSVR